MIISQKTSTAPYLIVSFYSRKGDDFSSCMRNLVGTDTAEDYEHSLCKNHEISSDGPILDVRNVQILTILNEDNLLRRNRLSKHAMQCFYKIFRGFLRIDAHKDAIRQPPYFLSKKHSQ